MKYFFKLFLIFFFYNPSFAQTYEFQPIIDLESLPVISQDKTGTCWSYSSSSFIESEIIRLTGNRIDISEMFQVRNIYPQKAENYILRQGKAQFDEGGLAHDFINSVRSYGLVPHEAYTGLTSNETVHNHSEMVKVLKAMVNVYVENPNKKLSKNWKESIAAILDIYLGKTPVEFVYEQKKYTPKSFLEYTKINPDNYITITSYLHQPFYTNFILNIPDNFSNGLMYNIPLNEFIQQIDFALEKGFTIALDCDVSEPTFSAKSGIAVIPENDGDKVLALSEIKKEKSISQNERQEDFENLTTTDDHLMHIVGKVQDQNGNIYYKVKNSWGSDISKVANGGFVYMSVPYIRLKGISIFLNKDALIPKFK